MIGKNSISKRLTCLLVVMAMLLAMIPLTTPAVIASQPSHDRVADPSTMDSWKELFPITGDITTENAGGVWTDKSVFTDASAFAGTGITQDNPDSFLVALSTIASNMTVTGEANMPTDTMVILDLSSSMYNGYSRNPATVQTMLTSVNDTISKLQNMNINNRVGVTVYYGGPDRNQSNATNSAVLLPLDRYTCSDTYLKAVVSSGRLLSVTVNTNVKNSAGETMPQNARVVTDVAGTYAQLGILDAMNQLLAADPVVPETAAYQPGAPRTPVIIFMSDGEPTAATHRYTEKVDAGMGNNTVPIRYPNETDFVTQLTASYAKEMVDAHYAQKDALFYSLSLGTSVSLAVMDPANHTTDTIADYWDALLANGSTQITVYNSPDGWSAPSVKKTYTVSTTTVAGNTFPAQKSQRDYVDMAFTANESGDLTDAFTSIVNQISLMSKYSPTLVADNADLSGYISFVDKVGQYMEVTDIKGILIGEQLFTGADLSSNFVSGGGSLGTYTDPTALGIEMVAAVRTRLGLASDDDARTLIGLAYEHGQLSYTDANNYSNYIGWYANAAGKFLGFYNEGTTVLPEATGDAATDPKFLIRSYGYLGAVDESHGVSESDMMYATVQVREDITTGDQLVSFAVPAALLPVVTYNVKLDEKGTLTNLTVTGADAPIRLIYEVALDSAINSFNVLESVSDAYLADEHNVNSDGSVNFFTNQWDHSNTTGYGTVNTYSYFNPSRQNDRYYYLEDAVVYSDTQGTVYTGPQPDADMTLYRNYTVYKNDETLHAETVYRPLSNPAKDTAQQKEDGSWYIPKGNVHVNLDGYTVHKSENQTGTLSEVNIPFVDTHNHSINDTGYRFYVGSTLGNNGKLSIAPETGIRLTKAMAEGVAEPGKAFTFTLTNESNKADATAYPAWLVKADGTEVDTTVQFAAGKATVELNPGDVLYIGGMTANETFKIVENETTEYVATSTGLSDAGMVTIRQNTLTPVDFVNNLRGTGNLTVSKEVTHDFGVDYSIPEDKVFTMQVTLSGIGTANATFAATQTNAAITQITTDANGRFTVQLGHGDQIALTGLPTGTVATVVERNPSNGFTPGYQDNGTPGDGIVTIVKDATASVLVINDYLPDAVQPDNVRLTGTKTVRNAVGSVVTQWPDAYRFTVVLERYGSGGWTQINSKTLNKDSQSFAFDLSGEIYDAPGDYYYRVYEVEPAAADADYVDGMIYDRTIHSFQVRVTDADMDGQLEIAGVYTDKEIQQAGGVYTVNVAFENTQTVTDLAQIVVAIQKVLNNPSCSPLVSLGGYGFGLYTDKACKNPAVVGDGIASIDLATTDPMGEGQILVRFDKAGSYTFYVKEIAGDVTGMSYSDAVIKVVVEVTIDAQDSSALSVSASYYDADGNAYDLGDDGEVEFTNTYTTTPAELTIDFVNKTLTGRDLLDEEFTFEVQLPDGTTVLKGTNNADGKVTFNGTLKFHQVGSQTYNVVETSTDGNGVITDKTTYCLNVTVTDIGGALDATYDLVGITGDTITFQNTYSASTVDHVVEGIKVLDGKTLLNDEFTFILTALSVDGEAVQNPDSWTAKNFANGVFRFPTITFDKVGTYVYTVAEDVPDGGKAYGITYDRTVYKVTLVIRDNGEGGLYVASEAVTLNDGTPADALRFRNTYKADPTWVQITGDKQLTGKVNNALKGGEFQFDLFNSDAGWTQGSLRQSVFNGVGGTITFDQIDFETAGDQYFLVSERNGGQVIDGITYDSTVYRVHVKVTDNLDGTLSNTVTITKANGEAAQIMAFVNRYSVTGTDSIELSGIKTLEGRDWTDTDAFIFELFEANHEFAVMGETPVATAQADNATGKFTLSMSYDAEDVGETFYYVVTERNGGQVIDGITYSDVAYNVTVTVRDNGDGTVKAEASVAGTTTDGLHYHNFYTADKTSIVFDGTKTLNTLIGTRPLKENDFTFDLYQTAADFLIGDMAIQSVSNDVDGYFTFDSVEFTEVGSYYFVVKENSQTPIGGVVYDNAQYHITVVVTDNGKGALENETTIMKVLGETAEAVDEIAFVNDYSAEATSVTLSGIKTLIGRELLEGEFRFLLVGADETFTALDGELPMVAFNAADQTFTFDALSFTETGTYYFLITEDKTVEVERITFDDAVYHVTIQVTDDENGKLVAAAPVIEKRDSTEAVDIIAFTNVFTPRPDDITVDIQIDKTVVNKGTDSITAEGFNFLLQPADGVTGTTITSDAHGNGKLTLTFSEEDIGKLYRYTLTEVNTGKYGVTYSAEQYAITIAITLDEQTNTLTAALTQNEAEVTELVAAFENIYDVNIPDAPTTGDDFDLSAWFILMFVCCGAVVTLCISDKKIRKR